jgi:hypothetical protein
MDDLFKFLVDRWFDIALTLLFLGLEWYNHVKSAKFEKDIESKLKAIEDTVQVTHHLAYEKEEERVQEK